MTLIVTDNIKAGYSTSIDRLGIARLELAQDILKHMGVRHDVSDCNAANAKVYKVMIGDITYNVDVDESFKALLYSLTSAAYNRWTYTEEFTNLKNVVCTLIFHRCRTE